MITAKRIVAALVAALFLGSVAVSADAWRIPKPKSGTRHADNAPDYRNFKDSLHQAVEHILGGSSGERERGERQHCLERAKAKTWLYCNAGNRLSVKPNLDPARSNLQINPHLRYLKERVQLDKKIKLPKVPVE